jgi:hypothetical protein
MEVSTVACEYRLLFNRFTYSHGLFHQLGLNGRIFFNSTLQERQSEYEAVSQHAQAFRDLTPGSGSYFVRNKLVKRLPHL